MKTWYPSVGGLVFIVKTALLIAFCMLSVGALSIVFRNRRTIQEVFGNLPSHKKRGLTALGVGVMIYTLYTLLGDVFVEWMYSVNPTLTQWMYLKFTYYFIPSLWIVIVLGIMGAFCIYLGGRENGIAREYKKPLGLLTSFAIYWILLELGLRTLGLVASYTEIREGQYLSPYDGDRSLWVREANTHHVLQSPEFSFDCHTNFLGFSDREFHRKAHRMPTYSLFWGFFTEGDGAPVDSAYPVLLEHALHTMDSSTSWEVWNVGLCGSDPIFNYITYDELLRTFEADLIIQTISEADIKQDFCDSRGHEPIQYRGRACHSIPRLVGSYLC